jgi:hypothetical protein
LEGDVSIKYSWTEISHPVFAALYAELSEAVDLGVFGTITDTHGEYGRPQVMTEWGMRGAGAPTLKSLRIAAVPDAHPSDWEWSYYMAFTQGCDCDD